MTEADKIRTNMHRLDKKVQRLNQMINNFDREMRNIKSKDKSGYSQQRHQASDNSSSLSYNEDICYEFKFTDEQGGELQRKTEAKTYRHSKPRDDLFSFLLPDTRYPAGKYDMRRDDQSKSANKDRIKE